MTSIFIDFVLQFNAATQSDSLQAANKGIKSKAVETHISFSFPKAGAYNTHNAPQ